MIISNTIQQCNSVSYRIYSKQIDFINMGNICALQHRILTGLLVLFTKQVSYEGDILCIILKVYISSYNWCVSQKITNVAYVAQLPFDIYGLNTLPAEQHN